MDGKFQMSYLALAGMVLFIGLAVGSTYWFVLYAKVHYFRRELSQEQRHNEVVGAKILPRSPIAITVINKKDQACFIDRAEVDGGDLWVYYHNASASPIRDYVIMWKGLAPDGTVIFSGYEYANFGVYLDSEEKAEYHYQYLMTDPRVASISVSSKVWR